MTSISTLKLVGLTAKNNLLSKRTAVVVASAVVGSVAIATTRDVKNVLTPIVK